MNADAMRLQAQRDRRETMRWLMLVTMNVARPTDATVAMLRGVIRGEYPDVTDLELRRELDYLEERDLVALRTDPLGQVRAAMTRHGIDLVEYTIDAEPGIARPAAGG